MKRIRTLNLPLLRGYFNINVQCNRFATRIHLKSTPCYSSYIHFPLLDIILCVSYMYSYSHPIKLQPIFKDLERTDRFCPLRPIYLAILNCRSRSSSLLFNITHCQSDCQELFHFSFGGASGNRIHHRLLARHPRPLGTCDPIRRKIWKV